MEEVTSIFNITAEGTVTHTAEHNMIHDITNHGYSTGENIIRRLLSFQV